MRCIVPLHVEQIGGMFSFVSITSLQVIHLKSYNGITRTHLSLLVRCLLRHTLYISGLSRTSLLL